MCCDFDPPEVYQERDVKARKPHVCSECGREIAVGEIHQYIKGLWDGSWSTVRTCQHCAAAREIVRGVIDNITGCDCLPLGDLKTEACQYADDDQCVARIDDAMQRRWREDDGSLMAVPARAEKEMAK